MDCWLYKSVYIHPPYRHGSHQTFDDVVYRRSLPKLSTNNNNIIGSYFRSNAASDDNHAHEIPVHNVAYRSSLPKPSDNKTNITESYLGREAASNNKPAWHALNVPLHPEQCYA
jgi:hypothetical protein